MVHDPCESQKELLKLDHVEVNSYSDLHSLIEIIAMHMECIVPCIAYNTYGIAIHME